MVQKKSPPTIHFLLFFFYFKAQQYRLSGQIIATSHDLTPKGSQGREISLFQGNPGW